MLGLITLIIFLLVFGLLVVVHEFGHFAAAKLSGVAVEEFAIGFGPVIFSKKYKETTYTIRALPLGGFVKPKGERGEESKDKDAYNNQPLKSKLFILSAGVVMNLILAVLLGMLYMHLVNYRAIIQNITEYSFVGPEVTVIPNSLKVTTVLEDGAAAGKIVAGDLLFEVNGEEVSTRERVLDILAENQGQDIPLKLINVDDFSEYEITVTLGVKVEEGDPILGVTFPKSTTGNEQDEVIPSFYVLNYPNNIFSGFSYAVDMFGYQIAALGSSVSKAVSSSDASVVTDQLSSPVGVFDIVKQILSAERLKELINLMVVLNLALAFFNLLPIPILDGGQMVIESVEKVRGKRFSDFTMNIMIYVALFFILLLFVVVVFKDLRNLGIIASISDLLKTSLGR